MADKFLGTGGRGDDGKAKAFITDNEGKQYISSKDSVEVKYWLQEVEIRDTNFIRPGILNLSDYRRVTFMAHNRTDSPIRIRPQFDGAFINYYESGEFVSTSGDQIVIPPNTRNVILNDVLPRVLNIPISNIAFVVNAQEAPTEGTFTLQMFGLKR